MVFDEVLFVAGRDICTKDITRIRGGWAIHDVFYVSIGAEPGHLYHASFQMDLRIVSSLH